MFRGSLKHPRVLVKSAAGLCLVWLVGWLVFPFALALVPLPAALFSPAPPDAEFVDRNGKTLREAFTETGHRGRPLALADVASALIQATLASEDKRFWEHHGVDWQATFRAAWQYVRYRRVISGGSTITQQLIKLNCPRPRTVWTKLCEAAQAMRLEQVWPKERILTEYLNRLDYGNRRFGCEAAARFYFAKPPADLSLAEAALLAGLPQAPTRLNPYHNLPGARKRQQWILGRLHEEGWVADGARDRAAREPLRLSPPHRIFQAPHFVDLLWQLEPTATNGVVRTTLDLPLNAFAEQTLRAHLAGLRDHHVGNGAVVVMENRTGHVLALVGSEDYFELSSGQVNGAWAPRSAGSTFKPFTYLLALEKGATPATLVADLPCDFATPTGVFSPVNYNRQCYGPLRYRAALANSLNIPAVKVLESIGGPASLQQRLARCGLSTLTAPPETYGLGLTIGNAEARLLELANAYACIARMGESRPFRLIASDKHSQTSNATGVSPALAAPFGVHPSGCSPAAGSQCSGTLKGGHRTGDDGDAPRLFEPALCYLIADILSDNYARSLAFDLENNLRFDFPVACKTGTSSDFRDNWAFGFTPEFTVGVWVGNFDGSPMRQVSGVSGAAPVMHEVMVRLHRQFGTSWYAQPASIVERHVHRVTGKLVAAGHPEAVREKFLATNLPAKESPEDYDAQGRIRLPLEYRAWLAGGNNWLGGRAVAEGSTSHSASPRLLFPLPGTVFFLDPDAAQPGDRLSLRAESPHPVTWQSETLQFESHGDKTIAILIPGRHEIVLKDAQGAEVKTWIEVKSL